MIVFLLLFSFALASSLVLTPTERNVSPVKPIIKPSEFLSSSSKHANVGEVTVTDKVRWTPYIQLSGSLVLINFPDLRSPIKKIMKNAVEFSKKLAADAEVAAKDNTREKIATAQEKSETVNLKSEENRPKTDPNQAEIHQKQHGESNLAEKQTQSETANVRNTETGTFKTKTTELPESVDQSEQANRDSMHVGKLTSIEKRLLNSGSQKFRQMFLKIKDTRNALKLFIKSRLQRIQDLSKFTAEHIDQAEDQFVKQLDVLHGKKMKARLSGDKPTVAKLDNDALAKMTKERILLRKPMSGVLKALTLERNKMINVVNARRREMLRDLLKKKLEKGSCDTTTLKTLMQRETAVANFLARNQMKKTKYYKSSQKVELRSLGAVTDKTRIELKKLREKLDSILEIENQQREIERIRTDSKLEVDKHQMETA